MQYQTAISLSNGSSTYKCGLISSSSSSEEHSEKTSFRNTGLSSSKQSGISPTGVSKVNWRDDAVSPWAILFRKSAAA